MTVRLVFEKANFFRIFWPSFLLPSRSKQFLVSGCRSPSFIIIFDPVGWKIIQPRCKMNLYARTPEKDDCINVIRIPCWRSTYQTSLSTFPPSAAVASRASDQADQLRSQNRSWNRHRIRQRKSELQALIFMAAVMWGLLIFIMSCVLY